jgi:hypothetical protein
VSPVLAGQHAAAGGGDGEPRQYHRLEDLTARVTVGVWGVSVASMVVLLVHHPVSRQGAVAVVVVMVASVVGFLTVFARRWRVRHVRTAKG